MEGSIWGCLTQKLYQYKSIGPRRTHDSKVDVFDIRGLRTRRIPRY